MTHHNATFAVLATDGPTVFAGLSQNGESGVARFTSLDQLHRFLAHEVACSVKDDAPLIVVVGKHKTRATPEEVRLFDLTRAVVRKAARVLPETSPVYVAGAPRLFSNSYFAPRVFSRPLRWATKSTSMRARVETYLADLAFGDEALALIPKRRTYVGA